MPHLVRLCRLPAELQISTVSRKAHAVVELRAFSLEGALLTMFTEPAIESAAIDGVGTFVSSTRDTLFIEM